VGAAASAKSSLPASPPSSSESSKPDCGG
jgi:hypothetical protein